MKRTRASKTRPMTPDAYAGFIQLLLTPAARVPRQTTDLDAYLRYLGEQEPLSDVTLQMLGVPTVEAA